jgi:hypothetical protein
VGNIFQFEYNKLELFVNPEPQFAFSMYFRLKNSNLPSLPFFITKNYTNGSLGGLAGYADVGLYYIECVGVDNAFWETVMPFAVIVKRNLLNLLNFF